MLKSLLLSLLLLSPVVCAAEDWPQWLGPQRNGISAETGSASLLLEPRKLWRASVGVGCSSVAVRQGRAYTMGHLKQTPKRGLDTVYCLDAESGTVVWKHSYDCATCISQDVLFDGPRSTPTVEGNAVYTLSAEGDLFCFDAASGKIVWSKDLTKDLPGRIPVYGYCCSPLVNGNLLILELNAPNASYVALDKVNGQVVWQASGGNVTCGSPALMRLDGLDCAVFAGGGAVVGLEAATGKELWRHRTWGHAWMGPVVSGNKVFMANASLPRGCGLSQIDNLKPKVLWQDSKKFQTLHCNAVMWDGHIYGTDNTGTDYQGTDSKKSALKCLDAKTGEVKWARERMGWGNLIVSDGKLILLRETGELVMADASPLGYDERARVQVMAGPSWTVPALANGKLYCRNKAGDVVCLQLKATGGEAVAGKDTSQEPGTQSGQVAGKPTAPGAAKPAAESRPSRDEAPAAKSAIRNPQSEIEQSHPASASAEWSRFRGPGGLGIVPFPNIPTSWNSQTGEGILWKAAIPLPGPNSPVLWCNRLFLTGANQWKREVYCFDADSGKLLWQREVKGAPGSREYVGQDEVAVILAAPTSIVDGQFLHVMFGTGDVACFDLDGQPVWSRNLGLPENSYGHAASLARWRNLLLIQLDQGTVEKAKSKLLALEADSGHTAWESMRPVPGSWSSPVVIRSAGQEQIIACGGPWVMGYEPATGTELWRVECLGGEVVPSPIQAAGLVLAGSVDGKFGARRPDGRGEVTPSHLLWAVEEDVPAICSPVSNGELVFLVNSGGLVVCCDLKDGKRLWEKDWERHFQASPCLVGDLLYLLSDPGEMFILKAGRECELMGRSALGEECQASPAFQPGRIFIRAKKHLYGIGLSDRP
ncbi:MAG: PQQ-binding-like beta-propeller repeat protein [Verrucomicrobiota bacterium]